MFLTSSMYPSLMKMTSVRVIVKTNLNAPNHFRCPLLVGDGVRVCVPPSEGEPHPGLAGVELRQLLGVELGQEGDVVRCA